MEKLTIWIIALMLSSHLIGATRTLQMNPQIKEGKLDNGLSYYIMPCYNSKYASMYLVTNIGSVVEEPLQQGMAHFTEHLLFDGTEHYPGKSIKTALEQYGLKYGENFNAVTGLDNTTLYINKIDPQSLEQMTVGLRVLHDMGAKALIETQAVEEERKIILEELRQGAGAGKRVSLQMMKILYGEDNPYCHLPIGNEETISSFKAEDIAEFYHHWYQPQHQAIIVTGPVDVKQTTRLIREAWKDVSVSAAPSVRTWTEIPEQTELKTAIITDSELQGCQIDVWAQVESPKREQRNTTDYYNKQLTAYIAAKVVQNRMENVVFMPGSCWTAGDATFDQYMYADSKDGFRLRANYDINRRDEALQYMMSELKRLHDNGILDKELQIAITNLRRYAQGLCADEENYTASKWGNILCRQFTTGNVQISAKKREETYENFCDTITTVAVNHFLKTHLNLDQLAIILSERTTSNTTHPTPQQLNDMVREYWQSALPMAEISITDLDSPWIKEELRPGAIVSITEIPEHEAKEYTLQNGAKVIVAYCDNYSDEITLRAVQRGGESVMLGQGFVEGYYAPTIAELCGMGDFSVLDIRRRLSGMKAELNLRHHPYSEIIEGECRPEELETLLQLLHLRLTSVRDDSIAVANWKTMTKGRLNDMKNSFNQIFSDSLRNCLYGPDNIYLHKPTVEDLDTLDYRRALDLFSQRIENAANWDFIITGPIEWGETEGLIETYIGSLPGDGSLPKPEHHVVNRRAIPEPSCKRFTTEMEEPFTRVYHAYELQVPYRLIDELTVEVLDEILSEIFIEVIREECGAAYSPLVGCTSSELDGFHSLFVTIDTNPEEAQNISDTITEVLNGIATVGPEEDMFDKILSRKIKETEEDRYSASYPMRYFTHLMLYDDRHVEQRAELMHKITINMVKEMAAALLTTPARHTIIVNSE